ncbi:4-hydroxy-3-methylbut-2-enyl diphosphate reductase [Bacteroidota bacterium]
MKKFDIPNHYKSSIIAEIKKIRIKKDPRKKDYNPTILDFGPVCFYVARHFGFCYGVENAIELAYKIIREHPARRIYLLSEIIHNPSVNQDLSERGVKFIMDTSGKMLIDWDELEPKDIVIIPAFGTTIEIENTLNNIGINPYKYNTTCPFVEKVWNRASSLGTNNFTVIIHGKHYHEETRATFSHSKESAPSLVVRNLEETKILSKIILGEIDNSEFYKFFDGKFSDNFNATEHLDMLGVVNQTTMLSSETEGIADLLKQTMIKKYGVENLAKHYADTRDTLCYATNDNQDATYDLLNYEADFAIVIGGYNSSNTTHIVELLEKKFKTYFISSPEKIISKKQIYYFDIHNKTELLSENYLLNKDKIKIVLTSGASCPDSKVDEVINKLLSFFERKRSYREILTNLEKTYSIN